MALIYQPSKRIFCGWFEPLKSTTYSEYPAKTALSDHGRQRYSLEKKREALELFNRGYGYKRASIVLGVPAYTVRDWNRLYKENRFLQSGSTLDTKSLWEETADEG